MRPQVHLPGHSQVTVAAAVVTITLCQFRGERKTEASAPTHSGPLDRYTNRKDRPRTRHGSRRAPTIARRGDDPLGLAAWSSIRIIAEVVVMKVRFRVEVLAGKAVLRAGGACHCRALGQMVAVCLLLLLAFHDRERKSIRRGSILTPWLGGVLIGSSVPAFSGAGIRANSTAYACLRAAYRCRPRCGVF